MRAALLFFLAVAAMALGNPEQGAEFARQALETEERGENATLLWLRASELGNETAQFRLGVMYAFGRGGLVKDDARAVLHYYFSSLAGYIPALMALGSRHHRGDGVPQKCRTSVANWERAADALMQTVDRGTDVEPFVIQERLPKPDESRPEGRAHGDDDVVEYYHSIATKGDISAMVMLGRIFYSGVRGMKRDAARAFTFFAAAAAKGDYSAMTYLAHLQARGAEGVPMNLKAAFGNYSAASEAGYASAFNGLGYFYLNGFGVVPPDTETALKYFTKAADHGVTEAAYNLGVLLLTGQYHVKRDFMRAVKYLQVAAQKGSLLGMHKLGHMALSGMGMQRACRTAALYFKTVAERASEAMSGPLYASALAAHSAGRIDLALDRYLVLAEMGYEVAESNAAMLFDDLAPRSAPSGPVAYLHYALDLAGVRHPHLYGTAEALALYERAAEQGNHAARVKVGDFNFYGYGGLAPDASKSAAHYRIASEGKEAQAFFNLGYLHHYGLGLPHDVHLAKRYYDLALETSPDAKLPVTLALFALWWQGDAAPAAHDDANGAEADAESSSPSSSPSSSEPWTAEVNMETASLVTLVAIFIGLHYVRQLRRR